MISRLTRLGFAILVAGCAAKSAEEVATTPAPESGGARIADDLVRSQKLADALGAGAKPSPRPVPSTVRRGFPPGAVRAGEAGSAIVAFVVLPNGRVDRESRTLVYVEGHPIYAKYICDALLAAKFQPKPADARGKVGVFPVFFYFKEGPARDSAKAKFESASRTIASRFVSMSYDQSLSWFQARPSCSKLKIGFEPLYGPPPL